MAPKRAACGVHQVTAPASELQDLPDALLNEIALAIDTRERHTLLPVLSKRWAGLLQGPGPAWGKVVIDADGEFPGGSVADTAAVAVWFSRRAGSVVELTVTGSVPKLPASLMTTVLMSQAASLRGLVLNLDASPLSVADLGVLAVLTGLKTLTIELPVLHEVWGWDDHAAAVIRTLSRLSDLTKLVLDAGNDTADAAQPTVSELSAFQSTSLLYMHWPMTSTPEGTLVLGALPALEMCRLIWGTHEGHVLHVTPASFSGATSLTGLHLRCHNQLQLAPGGFSRLGMLTELTLENCGLTAIPAALSGVRNTLRWLDLSQNEELHIDQAGSDTLLALPLLKWLDLRKSEFISEEPEKSWQWTIQSTRFLLKLVNNWHELRPGAALPDLNV